MNHEEEHDEQLQRILRNWEAPSPGESLDARILASFHRNMAEVPRWIRLFRVQIAVPLPAVAAFMGAFVFLVVFFVSHTAFRPGNKPLLQENQAPRGMLQSESILMNQPPDSDRKSEPEMDSALIRTHGESSYVTKLDLQGFQPLPRGTIQVERMDTRK